MLDVQAQEAFIERIREDHTNDLPRLIYADWLDEQGDTTQAELIRVQCATAKLLDALPSPELARLRHYEAELSSATERFAKNIQDHVTGYSFHRGLLDRVTVTPKQFVQLTPAHFAEYPLTHFRFCDLDESTPKLAKSPSWRYVRALDFAGAELNHTFVLQLLRAPYLRNLNVLDLSEITVMADVLRMLLCSPVMDQVQILHLSGLPKMIAAAIDVAFSSSYLQQLQVLDVRDNQAPSSSFRQLLAQLPHFPQLRAVLLSGNELGQSPYDVNLFQLFQREVSRHGILDLANNQIHGPFVRALVRQALLADVVRLNLSQNPIGDEGLTMIAQCDKFSKIESLSLRGCFIRDEGIYELYASPIMNTLQHIDLRDNLISIEAINRLKYISELRHVPRIEIEADVPRSLRTGKSYF